jgi:hypothetical protein
VHSPRRGRNSPRKPGKLRSRSLYAQAAERLAAVRQRARARLRLLGQGRCSPRLATCTGTLPLREARAVQLDGPAGSPETEALPTSAEEPRPNLATARERGAGRSLVGKVWRAWPPGDLGDLRAPRLGRVTYALLQSLVAPALPDISTRFTPPSSQ